MADGGAIAIAIAVSIAASLAAAALTPKPKIDNGGLNDLTVPKSNYGVAIPQGWGTVGVSSNLLWATEKIEVEKEEKQGKGGGASVTNRTYFANFAVLFGYCPHRPANRLKRLWFNNKLVYDINNRETEELRSKYLRFYRGTDNQQPDPLIESTIPIQAYDYGLPHDITERQTALTDLGLDPNLQHIPGYRYKCYMVAENLPLEDYGNQIPVVKAEIEFDLAVTLDVIIGDICQQSGLTPEQYDLSGIQGINVTGFFIDKVTSATEVIQSLQRAYFFDIYNDEGQLKFVAHSTPREIIEIPLSVLAAHAGKDRGETFLEEFPAKEDLPSQVEINFLDRNGDYNNGNVIARSQIGDSNRLENYTFSLVLTDSEAQAVADRILHLFYLESRIFKFTLPPAYSYLEIGDRLLIDFHGLPETVELTKIRQGANLLLQCEAKLLEQAATENAVATRTITSGGFERTVRETTQIVTSQGDTNLQILDINLISNNDPDRTFYLSANGGNNWRECSIYLSADGSSWYLAGAIDAPGVIGTLSTSFDLNSTQCEVILESGTLESISAIDADNGINKLLIGSEILQFQNASLTANNTYTLSGLRRGIRGTETLTTHTSGERVILLTGTKARIEKLTYSESDIGQVRYFKAPSPGQTLDAAPVFNITVQGNSLKPYAPINASATVDGVGNITITWDRRDRRGNGQIENLPLSELQEKWEIDILDTGNPTRTINSDSNFCIYKVSEQIADFGSQQSNISVQIHQMSTVVGRGYPLSATLIPTPTDSPPTITSFSPYSGNIGDTISVYGSGLAGVTGAFVGGAAIDNLAVVSDSEINFTIDTGTTSGLIEVISPGGIATSNQAFVVNSNIAIPLITGIINITADTTINDSHFGKLLLVDTSANDVTLTLDNNVTIANFTFVVQKAYSAHQVKFIGNGSNSLYANDLIDIHQALRFYQIGNNWHGF